jgi:two-component system OmpR family response regulator
LRRTNALPENGAPPSGVLSFEGWQIDPLRRELLDPSGTRVTLTSAEFDLLLAFCQHHRRTLSREQLLDLTQGRSAAPFDRSVDILVSRIRRKIERSPREPEFIKTVRSGGYIFTPEVAAA